MKKIYLGAMLLFITAVSSAQASLQSGNNQLNVGVGLTNWGVPIYFGFDFGLSRDISLGLELSYRSYNENYHEVHYNHNIIGFSGNANYHFNRVLSIPNRFDLYAGLNLGFYVWNSPNNYTGNNSPGLNLGAQVGGRYFITSKVGLNLEFGGGSAFSGGKFGLTFKL